MAGEESAFVSSDSRAGEAGLSPARLFLVINDGPHMKKGSTHFVPESILMKTDQTFAVSLCLSNDSRKLI